MPALEPMRHEPPALGEAGEVGCLPRWFRDACTGGWVSSCDHPWPSFQSVVKMSYLDLFLRNARYQKHPLGPARPMRPSHSLPEGPEASPPGVGST